MTGHCDAGYASTNKPTLVSELEQVKWLEKEELLRCKDEQIRELEKQVKFLIETTIFFANPEASEVSVYRATSR